MINSIQRSFQDAAAVLDVFNSNPEHFERVAAVSAVIATAFQNGNKVLICGNGGSTCDAMHFAEEFTGRYRQNRKALPVISLSDASHITCVANDFGFEHVFRRGVEAFGKAGDVFIGISTSGNSKNVVLAHDLAKELQLTTLNFLGKNGGALAGKGDYEFIVPGATTDRIQELHMLILHIIIESVERQLFPDLY